MYSITNTKSGDHLVSAICFAALSMQPAVHYFREADLIGMTIILAISSLRHQTEFGNLHHDELSVLMY
jgi:hypothetical protein